MREGVDNDGLTEAEIEQATDEQSRTDGLTDAEAEEALNEQL